MITFRQWLWGKIKTILCIMAFSIAEPFMWGLYIIVLADIILIVYHSTLLWAILSILGAFITVFVTLYEQYKEEVGKQ